jgi:hypothetical protein
MDRGFWIGGLHRRQMDGMDRVDCMDLMDGRPVVVSITSMPSTLSIYPPPSPEKVVATFANQTQGECIHLPLR